MRHRGVGIAGIITIVVLVVVAFFAMRLVTELYVDKPQDASQVLVIETGSSVDDITRQLTEYDLLDSPFLFKLYGRLSGHARSIQAGSFEIPVGHSIRELYRILGNGRALEREVTIVDGWTLQQVQDHLVAREFGTEVEVRVLMQPDVWEAEYPFLDQIPAGLDIEGYLFPETYRVLNTAGAEDVIRRALDEFVSQPRSFHDPDYAFAHNGTNYTLFDVVTIASIIEREVRDPADMARVADLIYRRLEIGMPLQMDSTVNYVTGKNDPGILLVDRDVESPYNTYKYAGLPVGPISNPGAAALHAALNPEPNPYLFFLTTPEGEVIYARTHDEHVGNKSRYLR